MRFFRARSTVISWAALAVLAGVAGPSASATAPATQPAVPIAPELVAQVEDVADGEPVTALAMLPNPTELDGSYDEVLTELRQHAATTQAEVERHLAQRAATGRITVLGRLWLTNALLVEFPASERTLGALAETPGIDHLVPNFEVRAPETVDGHDLGAQELTWGLTRIESQRVWDELGVTGAGAKVAVLDTGVAADHPDLAGKMFTTDPTDPRRPGGWAEFDSTGGRVDSTPHDSADHGTHVTGTVVGGDASGTAIGVAPDATYIHGEVIPSGRGTFAQVAAGMQWAVAPTDIDGNPAGPAPDVVSMSLGINTFANEMIAPTRAIRAAGIVPAFAIGNSCGSAGTASPGNVYDAVGVGATDVNDNVASFSCGGVISRSQWSDPPAQWPAEWVKPDISAPGVDVLSAAPGGGYATHSGTSMATPHVAGAAALMRSAAPGLSVDDLFTALADTSFWDDRNSPDRPDTRFGHGRINAYEATARVAVPSGIAGTVSAAGTGEPVAGATVVVTPGNRTLTTKADGAFATRLAPGTYELTVTAFGHDTATVPVAVTENTFVDVDVPLTVVPNGSLTGVVTFTETGHGVPGATVRVLDVPVDLSATTDTDGRYTVDGIPAGAYSLRVSAPTFATPTPIDVTVTANGSTVADVALHAAPPSVAVVANPESYGQEIVDTVLTPAGIPATVYPHAEIDRASRHPVVLVGYSTSTGYYNRTRFQAMLDATDASGAGVIFLDHATGSRNGLAQLSVHTGQPEGTWQTSGWVDPTDVRYEVTEAHPIFGDRAVGDHVVLAPADSTVPRWAAWFAGYEGDGRRIIGALGRESDGGAIGGGVAIDERPNNRHVLLSMHATGAATWTADAEEIFLNAIDWAAPERPANGPHLTPYDLTVDPGEVQAGTPVSVSVRVKNVGASTGTYDAELRVGGSTFAITPVTLATGASTTVRWTVTPDTVGTFPVEVGPLSSTLRVRAPVSHREVAPG
ncbi:hypothetical protein BLA60_03915 [Actinophytocola xinjiangensis]|uniref:Alpha-amylase n=1 Tax=Actinophytocola xinjiangensis TaxID=485602 RepID=A0A7Z1B1I4_9PSEU|nr:S8 family serine peptidase [Actinophytocola xinjiangensis]OLF14291.1 hypothetical protein BLA60_03915 [Actinophytocola xinjiangensis]